MTEYICTDRSCVCDENEHRIRYANVCKCRESMGIIDKEGGMNKQKNCQLPPKITQTTQFLYEVCSNVRGDSGDQVSAKLEKLFILVQEDSMSSSPQPVISALEFAELFLLEHVMIASINPSNTTMDEFMENHGLKYRD